MSEPKRAEPAVNEHAGRLMNMAEDLGGVPGDAHDLIAAAAEIERLAALDRPWLPIASAPRDGTRLELWDACEPARPTYGKWDVFGYYPAAWRSDSGIEIDATHWRPGPAGPNESKPDQETS